MNASNGIDADSIVCKEARKEGVSFEQLLETSEIGRLQFDGKGTIQTMNPVVARWFGYSTTEAMLHEIHADVCRLFVDAFECRNLLKAAASNVEGMYRECLQRGRDGAPFWLGYIIHGHCGGGDPACDRYEAWLVPIDRYKHIETACEEKNGELRALQFIGQETARNPSIAAICRAGVQGMLQAVDADMAFVFLRDKDRLFLQEIFPDSSRSVMNQVPIHRVGECLCGLCVQQNEALFSKNIFEDSRCSWQECKAIGVRSFAALPLQEKGNAFGVIGLGSFRIMDFEGHRLFLETLSHQIAVSLLNAKLYQSVKEAMEQSRESERAILQEQWRLRTILEAVPFGICMFKTGTALSYANPIFLDLFGYDVSVFSDERTWFERLFPDHGVREKAWNFWIRHRQKKERSDRNSAVFEVCCADGSKKHVRFWIVPLESGESILICEDITERLMLEEQLQQAQKMESIGVLAGGIAHDFNNLLQAIRGQAQLLMIENREDDPRTERIQAIDASVERGAKLVRQLLLFSRKSKPVRTRIDLNDLIAREIDIIERTIPKMVRISFEPDPELWPIMADSVQIEQLLLNLAINAADAMPEGGHLMLSTQNVAFPCPAGGSSRQAETDRYVRLRVTDTGCGIPEDIRKHIFEPFFSTKSPGKGTGLGLASVYGIVKAHDGEILCESELGKGTTFQIDFPASEPFPPSSCTHPVDTRPIHPGKGTILVVDDVADIRSLLKEMLEHCGYEVLTAESGEDALRIHEHPPAPIDLTILDLGMPGMGGYQCLKRLQETNPEIKVLIASGYGEQAVLQSALMKGCVAFVPKPFRLQDLLNRIQSLIQSEGP